MSCRLTRISDSLHMRLPNVAAFDANREGEAMKRRALELIDWSERFPQEDSRTIAIRQSTYCCCKAADCRKQKEIGVLTCKG